MQSTEAREWLSFGGLPFGHVRVQNERGFVSTYVWGEGGEISPASQEECILDPGKWGGKERGGESRSKKLQVPK